MTEYNQTFWAVSDPNWGNPVVIPETIRPGQMDAETAFCNLMTGGHHLYHGGSILPYPDGTPGSMERARSHGYRLVKVKINTEQVEVIG